MPSHEGVEYVLLPEEDSGTCEGCMFSEDGKHPTLNCRDAGDERTRVCGDNYAICVEPTPENIARAARLRLGVIPHE